jgi:hypothetical protein
LLAQAVLLQAQYISTVLLLVLFVGTGYTQEGTVKILRTLCTFAARVVRADKLRQLLYVQVHTLAGKLRLEQAVLLQVQFVRAGCTHAGTK